MLCNILYNNNTIMIRKRRLRKRVRAKPQPPFINRKPKPTVQTKDGVTLDLHKVVKALNSICRHQIYHHNRTDQDPIVCTSIGTILLNALKVGIPIDKYYLQKYLSYLFKTSVRYGMKKRCTCINDNIHHIIPIINGLLGFYIPKDNILVHLYTYRQYIHLASATPPILLTCLTGLESNDGFKYLSNQGVLTVLKKEFSKCDPDGCNSRNHSKVLHLLLKHTQLTSEVAEFMVGCKCHWVQKLCVELAKKGKLTYTKQQLYDACKLLPASQQLVESLVKMPGLSIDSQCLEEVCAHASLEGIKYILNYKIPVKRSHFNKLIMSKKGRGKTTKHCGYTPEKVELLFRSGYRMDREDIILSIQNKLVIPDIERFGIVLDDGIYVQCHKLKFYPNYKFTLSNLKLVEFQKMCNRKSSKLEDFIEKHKLTPDQVCLDNACTVNRNFRNIAYLIDKGCTVTNENLVNILKHVPQTYWYRRLANMVCYNKILVSGRVTYLQEILGYKIQLKELNKDITIKKHLDGEILQINREIERLQPSKAAKEGFTKPITSMVSAAGHTPPSIKVVPDPISIPLTSNLDLDDIDISNIDIDGDTIKVKPKIKKEDVDIEDLMLDIDIDAILQTDQKGSKN